jgi:hypothetical protein
MSLLDKFLSEQERLEVLYGDFLGSLEGAVTLRALMTDRRVPEQLRIERGFD